MKVLVTGGCGFIGSHVCEFYTKLGAEVISYDNMTKHELARTGYNAAAARDYTRNLLNKLGVKLIKADVRDRDTLRQASQGCDFIVHTAAQPAMTISLEDPDLDFSTNVTGTYNVLTVARELDIPMVYCCTIHVYGNRINETLTIGETRYLREPAAIDENHPTLEGLLTPLHASKRAAEIYVQTFIDSYGVKAASFRLTGLYGPYQLGGEDHGWVANFAIRTVLGWPLTIYGTGKQVRDILFATDVVQAFHAFYQNPQPGIYNIGGGPQTSISLLECVKLLQEITGRKAEVRFAPDRLGDLRYFISDITKAQKVLAWRPRILPEEGVKRLLSWVEENLYLFKSSAK